MPSTQQFQTVVFVDPPDPDNILMILHAFAISKGPIAIVLSPRIVDLSVLGYGPEFLEMKEELGFKTMFEPIIKGKEPKVREEWKEFFQADGNLSDPEVMKDTRLYVNVSATRIRECIEEQYPDGKNYEIFWDPNSLTKITKPDMRHAFHAADYTFNFNQKERSKYDKIIEKQQKNIKKRSGSNLPSLLRKRLRNLCHKYLARQTEKQSGLCELGPSNIQHLFTANEEVDNTTLLVGGPLTEALQYMVNTRGRPDVVYAILGTLTRDRNPLDRPQFNVGKDANSAFAFLNLMFRERIATYIVPTECCKGKDEQDDCPYVLKRRRYQNLLETSPLMFGMVAQWVKETGGNKHYNAFDWITAAVVGRSTIFNWVRVEFKALRRKDNVEGIEFSETESESTIQMAKSDYEHMRKMTKELMEELEKTLPTNRL